MVSSPSEPITVTLVDDEPAALDVLVRAARSWDFNCQSATSAEQALRLLESNPTPVVVTDLRMPGMGGAWLVREIQKRWPEVSVIVVTAGQEIDALSQCLDAGAHQYFLKPINFDEFHLALESTLRTHRRHREMRSQKQHLELCLHRQRRRLGKTFLSAVDSFVRLLEARDPFLSGHSLRVSSYVMHMAARLDLDSKTARRLHVAAKLHDIGKVGVPETILNKPGKLSPEEYTLVRKHPVIAQRILSPILRSRAVLTAIRGHHERFDGKGYPDNLRGGNIPLLARIITIADAYDAMTSTRAYRAALGHAAAVEIIQNGAGTQFDPELVGPFLEVVSRYHR